MSRPYERRTDRRSREERKYSVRAEHRAPPDVDLLAELLIRFALQETGAGRASVSEPGKAALAGIRAQT